MQLRPCLNCGHPAEEHAIHNLGAYVTHDGATLDDIRLGGCDHPFGCACLEWDPDTLSHLTELIGLEARRVILY